MAKTTKTATKAADVKKEEVKVAATPVVKTEVKKEEVKAEVPAKKEEAKKTTSTKKATTKKETAKKETTKKTTTKKAETKVVLQFQHLDVDTATIVENAKADYIANSGKKTAKDVAVYVKPEEFTAYYVIDGVSGKVNL